MIKALIYNEWRQQRSIISGLFFADFMILAFGAMLLHLYSNKSILPAIIIFCSILIPLSYMATLAKTFKDFSPHGISQLRSLPVSPAQIFWNKFCFTLTISVGLGMISGIIIIMGFGQNYAQQESGVEFLIFCMASLWFIHVAIFTIPLFNPPWIFILVPQFMLLASRGKGLFLFMIAEIIVGIIMLCFGHYLWTRRIAYGLSVRGLTWIGAGTSIIAVIILWVINEVSK